MVLWVLAGNRHVRLGVLHTGLEEAHHTVLGEVLVAERHTGLVGVRLVRHTDLAVVHWVVQARAQDGPGHRGMELPEGRVVPGSIFR